MAANPIPSVLSFSAATTLVREHAASLRFAYPRKTEILGLAHALGRVLGRPVLADRDQPPFDRSTRDGYACHVSDLLTGNAIPVTGQIRAGDPIEIPRAALVAGHAVEIMTGAPVPLGADHVVMFEHVEHDPEADTIRMTPEQLQNHPPESGANIVPAGAEARRGDIILHAGTRLVPAHIAAAAACGASLVHVYAPPRVSILASGDELVDLDATPLAHQIRNSNSYSLAAQVTAAGGHPHRLPLVRDDPGSMQSAIRMAMDSDLLLLSGGVSMGKYDFAAESLLALGAEFFFTGALIQPGKPVIFGRLPQAGGMKYFFALPGNPVSTMVTFALFVHPLLCALAGDDNSVPRFVLATLGSTVKAKPGLTRFLPAILSGGIHPQVNPIEWQGSGDLANTAAANCFLVVPADRGALEAEDVVTVLLN
ncbi:Molybdopterin biosynthesis protein MoeA [Acidisarcina polymorpha]|uniref:Molybdopterin molybdenumtransferase n=1 Tax=Acidisarcina polymorpha TaxID=2211140 RepID=A0A2Z5FS38_9BACT|nr:gephyrin-like molybdotransferase Glp [Acidisarcina polymorpha]AXC09571.1 Molybdopterin biosynthesis protein MoeA [Acidisarcina polymorpha]